MEWLKEKMDDQDVNGMPELDVSNKYFDYEILPVHTPLNLE